MAAINSVMGKPVQILLQTKDGIVFSATGYAKSLTLTNRASEMTGLWSMYDNAPIAPDPMMEFDLEITGICETKNFMGEIDAKTRISRAQTDPNWQCPYCGQANPQSAHFCGEIGVKPYGCGGRKPIILEI